MLRPRTFALFVLLLGCDAGSGAPETGPMDAAARESGPDDAALDVGALADARADGRADGRAAAPDAASDAGPASDAADAADEPLQVWLEPDGDDANDGLAPERPLLTLERAQDVLRGLSPDREVEVRIGPGTYHAQQVSWTFTMPEHRIRFMPRDDDKNRPVFDGCLAPPSSECPGGTWLRLRHSDGGPTNLHFEYIRVQNYGTAISLDGNRNDADASNGNNRIYGCYFYRIGNVFNSALDPTTAAVRLVNSDDNEIANTHFVDVINTRSGGLIHAIYAAHMSSDNRIERNRFVRSTGDPVRIRDYSNGNIIRDNRFIRVGVNAGYTDWYCDHDARDDCTKAEPECPSWLNQFRDNTLDGTWTCGSLGTWELFQGDETTGCSPPSGDARRVRTSGNERTDTPCSME